VEEEEDPMKHRHREASDVERRTSLGPSGALNIRSIGTVTSQRERIALDGIQRICRIPRARAHTIDRTRTDVYTDARCTQNSGWPFIFVGSIYFRSLAARARAIVLYLLSSNRPTRLAKFVWRIRFSSFLVRSAPSLSLSFSLFLSLSLSR